MVTPQADLLDEIRDELANGSTDPNTGLPVRITATQLRAVLEALLAANYPKPVQQDGTEVEGMPSGTNYVGAVVTTDSAGLVTVTITGGTGARLRFGTGAPSDSLGSNNDSYLATDTGVFYLRASGAYTEQFTFHDGIIAELDTTRAYSKGEQAWSGSGAAFTVWTANQDIAANSTEPTRELPQDWIVESGAGVDPRPAERHQRQHPAARRHLLAGGNGRRTEGVLHPHRRHLCGRSSPARPR